MAGRRSGQSLRPGRPGLFRLLVPLALILAACLLVQAGLRRNAARLVPLEVLRPAQTTAPSATAVPTDSARPVATNAPTPSPAPDGPAAEATYVLNTSRRKFHRPECPSVQDMKEKNRQDFAGSREEVIAMGYEPCKRCNP